MEKTIKLSEIARLKVGKNEVLLIKEKAVKDYDAVGILAEELGCKIFLVKSFDELKVVSASKIKK